MSLKTIAAFDFVSAEFDQNDTINKYYVATRISGAPLGSGIRIYFRDGLPVTRVRKGAIRTDGHILYVLTARKNLKTWGNILATCKEEEVFIDSSDT